MEKQIITKLESIEKSIEKLNTPKMLYTTKEVSSILGFKSTDKVDLLRHLGILKAIKKGNGYLFPTTVIDEFIEDYTGLDITNEDAILSSACLVKSRKESKNHAYRI